MGVSIKFGTYSPPEKNGGRTSKTAHLSIGVFCDGTLNNKTNTESRLGEHGEIGKKAYEDNASDDSYTNDFSNIARMWDLYQGDLNGEKDNELKVYVEGVGTEDFEGDKTYPDAAMGRGSTGIRAKVRKGCEDAFEKIRKAINSVGAKEISILTIDVFGFSRGAAVARNFVHEISKAAYQAKQDKFRYRDSFDEIVPLESKGQMPAKGHLGYMLQKEGITVNNLKIRFLGLFDTVASYDPESIKNPNFSNDIAELNLNDITTALHILHLVAADEHRKFFALSPVPKGKEYYVPGVHADVGGSYVDMAKEGQHKDGRIQIMDIGNYWGDGYSDKEWDKILNADLERLTEDGEGWFEKEKTEKSNSAHETYGTRDPVSNKYSFVTLQIMCEQANLTTSDELFTLDQLRTKYSIEEAEAEDGTQSLLEEVKMRIEELVINKDRGTLSLDTLAAIETIRKTVKASGQYEHILKEVLEDRELLLKLRKRYLHFSSEFTEGANARGYANSNQPNFTVKSGILSREREILKSK
ncbi:MAG: T6SS phospholipase effector Tle1-like catalytic domain-containing protein [Bacteroidales bacterium]